MGLPAITMKDLSIPSEDGAKVEDGAIDLRCCSESLRRFRRKYQTRRAAMATAATPPTTPPMIGPTEVFLTAMGEVWTGEVEEDEVVDTTTVEDVEVEVIMVEPGVIADDGPSNEWCQFQSKFDFWPWTHWHIAEPGWHSRIQRRSDQCPPMQGLQYRKAQHMGTTWLCTSRGIRRTNRRTCIHPTLDTKSRPSAHYKRQYCTRRK